MNEPQNTPFKMPKNNEPLIEMEVAVLRLFPSRCVSCKFWGPKDSPKWAANAEELFEQPKTTLPPALWRGECHRQPPQLAENGRGKWPTTDLYDYCGEYAAYQEIEPEEPLDEDGDDEDDPGISIHENN